VIPGFTKSILQILETDYHLARHQKDRQTYTLIDWNQLEMPISITERHSKACEAQKTFVSMSTLSARSEISMVFGSGLL
jgi:hypothetical protein